MHIKAELKNKIERIKKKHLPHKNIEQKENHELT